MFEWVEDFYIEKEFGIMPNSIQMQLFNFLTNLRVPNILNNYLAALKLAPSPNIAQAKLPIRLAHWGVAPAEMIPPKSDVEQLFEITIIAATVAPTRASAPRTAANPKNLEAAFDLRNPASKTNLHKLEKAAIPAKMIIKSITVATPSLASKSSKLYPLATDEVDQPRTEASDLTKGSARRPKMPPVKITVTKSNNAFFEFFFAI